MKLPKRTGGRKVTRTVCTAEQVTAIAEKLKEPYATLVLFLAASGLRIGETLAIKPSDFTGNVLYISRRIYEGDVDNVKSKRSERKLPIDPVLMSRIEKLGKGEWVFRSRKGTPANPGNALKRYVRPAAKQLGILLGGWHDFRHTLSSSLAKWSSLCVKSSSETRLSRNSVAVCLTRCSIFSIGLFSLVNLPSILRLYRPTRGNGINPIQL